MRIGSPLGNASAPFTGTFDGNNHTIGNLTSQGYPATGLFGELRGATIRNQRIQTGDLSSSAAGPVAIGSLAGVVHNSTIQNVNAELNGALTARADFYAVGGLVGILRGPSILMDFKCDRERPHFHCQHYNRFWKPCRWWLGRIDGGIP